MMFGRLGVLNALWTCNIFNLHCFVETLCPGSLASKEFTCNKGDPNLIPESGIGYPLQYYWSSLAAQMVKNLYAMWENWVQSLDWEDPLEEGMETHFSILAWRIPMTEEPGGLQTMGSQRLRHNWATKHSTAQSDCSSECACVCSLFSSKLIDDKSLTIFPPCRACWYLACVLHFISLSWGVAEWINLWSKNYCNIHFTDE